MTFINDPNSSLSGYIESLSTNLGSTGSTLYGYITSLSAINNAITGSGYTNYLPKFQSNFSGITNSNITSVGSSVGINVQNPGNDLEISGNIVIYNNDTQTIIYATGIYPSWQEINIQNMSSGANASSDITVTCNSGNQGVLYLNFGINSHLYTGGFIGLTGDAYLINAANDFYIGNVTGGRRLLFFTSVPFSTITGESGCLMILDTNRVRVSGNIFASGGKVLTSSDSGVLNNYIISTGQNLWSFVTSDSGNLVTTGSTLYNLITGLSGAFNITGGTLNNKIGSLSGFVNNTSLSVTGFSAQTGLISLTGLGGVSLFTGAGNIIYISGLLGNFYYGPSWIVTGGSFTGSGGFNYVPKFTSLGTGFTQSNIININNYVGINNNNPQYDIDVSGSGNFASGIQALDINLIKLVGNTPPGGNYASLFTDNFANRNMLSIVNNYAAGKMMQNTFALEQIHAFSPFVTTTMNAIGTTAQTVGTLSHPTTNSDLTGCGYCTAIVTTVGSACGVQSLTAPFFMTSGITGLGAGFFFATQFNLTGTSGSWSSGSYGTTWTGSSGIRFFAGMTDSTTVNVSVLSPYPSGSLLGFQLIRSTGQSGRYDNNFQFVSKPTGASPMAVVDTTCVFNPGENIGMYIYVAPDYRNGINWMIRRFPNTSGQIIYSGALSTGTNYLPLNSSVTSDMLKPSIGVNVNSGTLSIGFKLKGMYCETV
jgi:hypothetical protein